MPLPEEAGTSTTDSPSPTGRHYSLENDEECSGDESEDEEDLFFEIFVSAAERFFAQIKEAYSEQFVEYVIAAMWERQNSTNSLMFPI